jgi:hypothetical protein
MMSGNLGLDAGSATGARRGFIPVCSDACSTPVQGAIYKPRDLARRGNLPEG